MLQDKGTELEVLGCFRHNGKRKHLSVHVYNRISKSVPVPYKTTKSC